MVEACCKLGSTLKVTYFNIPTFCGGVVDVSEAIVNIVSRRVQKFYDIMTPYKPGPVSTKLGPYLHVLARTRTLDVFR